MAGKDDISDKQVLELALDQLSKAVTVMDGIIERIHRELLDDWQQDEAVLMTAEIPADRTLH